MQAVAGELEQQANERYVSPYNMARVYAAGGERETAFSWLERACEERNPDLIELTSDPVFDALKTDPRFLDVMRRVGWTV